VALWVAYGFLISDFFVFVFHVIRWAALAGPTPEELRPVLALIDTLGSYALVVLINTAMLFGWARYNQMRFRGKERRKAMPVVTVADYARMYGFPPEEIASWQRARILIMHHDQNGQLAKVELAQETEPVG